MNSLQIAFAPQIVNLIYQAYTSGVLQYHSMTIMDITVEMKMYRHFNQLSFTYNNRLLSISMYDNDSDQAQESSIQELIADLVTIKGYML